MREFAFSVTNPREKYIFLLVFELMGISLGGMLIWFVYNFIDSKAFAAAIIIHLFIFVPAFLILTVLGDRRSRKWKVCVYEDKIVKQCGKNQHTLLWNDVAKVKTLRRKSGVFQVKLWTNKSKSLICLGGFKDMDDLANVIREKAPQDAVLRDKYSRLNRWQEMLVGVLLIGSIASVTLFIIIWIACRVGLAPPL